MTYIGRFAPSPTGPLHFGSLFTAIASYLDAKANLGKWLLRIEDIDTPRVMPGATNQILSILDAYGLHWDGEVVYQHQQTAYYQQLLSQLKDKHRAYGCQCSRKEIAEIAHAGVEGPVYPGTCRQQTVSQVRAWRFAMEGAEISFEDQIQGTQHYDIAKSLGDFVLFRADGLVAYQLAVVADDHQAGVTHIVRGIDLIHSTPRQMQLQTALGFTTPMYSHLPIIVSSSGQKLSKQNLATPVTDENPLITWHQVLDLLNQAPPAISEFDSLSSLIDWAISHWNIEKIPKAGEIIERR
ncbi:tRNA glutamyl-Q(34) synthetase GluQRS [Leeia sp. TBRC 13508]|uniref:Glutamyl-Q tRNA(Asp) synthetase n=1 Tax=Leeia speluncae TaxID=2884804 RepID=A0ABS8D2R1_9NEIS|nr:tRNA glutamyl-Q(34) synthetase GluQRS [Leeia speluncae]MCB6182491.1 tRNA glutamyl-Q(34) synthetase GluQRS [Leeia speluncae]